VRRSVVASVLVPWLRGCLSPYSLSYRQCTACKHGYVGCTVVQECLPTVVLVTQAQCGVGEAQLLVEVVVYAGLLVRHSRVTGKH
jgi:hypothetical protein